MAAPMFKHALSAILTKVPKNAPSTYLLYLDHGSFVRTLRGRAMRVHKKETSNVNRVKTTNESIQKNTAYNQPAKQVAGRRPSGTPSVKLSTRKNDQESKNEPKGTPAISTDILYSELQESDKRFGPVLMLTKSRKYREKEGKILLEGKRLISDGLFAGAKMEALYFSRLTSLDGLPLKDTAANIYKMKYKSLKNWSDVQTPSGLMGVFEMPKPGQINYQRKAVVPITLICDNIREPGNMGTLLRTAACVGCKRVLVSKGSVDIWEPKVLRAGAGAHFRVPILSNVNWGMMQNFVDSDSCVYLADSTVEAHYTSDRREISEALQTISELEKEREESLADGDDDSNEDDSDGEEDFVADYANDPRMSAYKQIPIDMLPYSEMTVSQKEAVLVVGGETEALSSGAHQLAYNNFGKRVHIPICDGTDSLNNAVASAVILFEMQRQYLNSIKSGKLNKASS